VVFEIIVRLMIRTLGKPYKAHAQTLKFKYLFYFEES
jgi:hypothetical protein